MRTVACVGLVAVCLIVPGLPRAEARPMPAGVPAWQEGGAHERQEERHENRVDRNEARRQLDSARTIIRRMRPSREEGLSRDSLEQLKAQFADMYNDFTETQGRRTERERRDWQSDYDRIQRTLDTLSIPERGEGGIGTSGHRDDERGRRNDLVRFRERLDAFYNAAAGRQWRR